MRIEELNSSSDGHREMPGKLQESARDYYYKATAGMSGASYNLENSFASGLDSSTGVFTPDPPPKGAKITAGSTRRPGGDYDKPEAGMTFEAFRKQCNACAGIPCPPPVPKGLPGDMRSGTKVIRELPSSTDTFRS